jgi:hypothetical protein
MAQSVQRHATGWTTGIRFPAGATYFPLPHSVQTGSEVHQNSSTTGTGLFPRIVKLTTNLRLVQRSRMVAMYLHSPIRLYGVVLNYLSPGTLSFLRAGLKARRNLPTASNISVQEGKDVMDVGKGCLAFLFCHP